ncbi:hypothetical protein [Angustibacter aerolatus]
MERSRGGERGDRNDREGVLGGPRREGPPEPRLPDDVTFNDLDRSVRAQLRSLTKANAEAVAKFLVMVQRTLPDDPQAAYAFAMAAQRRAGRVAVVREVAGVAAYHAGLWAEALSELRTARRMSGSSHQLPLMADAERGLGRPERALELSTSPEAATLAPEEQLELAIVVSGARRDLGQPEAGVLALQLPALQGPRTPVTPRLQYAYADALLESGRRDEALSWFARAADSDLEGVTDAEDRLAELQGLVFVDLEDEDSDAADSAEALEGDEQLTDEAETPEAAASAADIEPAASAADLEPAIEGSARAQGASSDADAPSDTVTGRSAAAPTAEPAAAAEPTENDGDGSKRRAEAVQEVQPEALHEVQSEAGQEVQSAAVTDGRSEADPDAPAASASQSPAAKSAEGFTEEQLPPVDAPAAGDPGAVSTRGHDEPADDESAEDESVEDESAKAPVAEESSVDDAQREPERPAATSQQGVLFSDLGDGSGR